MEFDRVHYLDTSVIVKFLLKEDDRQIVEDYVKKWHTSSFNATSLCFAEALGVMKSKYTNKKRVDHYAKKRTLQRSMIFAHSLQHAGLIWLISGYLIAIFFKKPRK